MYNACHAFCELYDGHFETEEIIITPCVKQGIYYLLKTLARNKVCVIEPTWLGYIFLTRANNKKYLRINRHIR